VDANAAGLRDVSRRALRAGLTNLVYVRAAVEDLPAELGGVADRVTVVLPWGSLLAAVACPWPAVLQRIRRLCRLDATLTVVLGVDPVRDSAETDRLALPPLAGAHFRGALADGYRAAGFTVSDVRAIGLELLSEWPTTWARRLAHGRPRAVFRLEARATALRTP
jgi:16S rRNA (adenine(1408)-N(1))-methyltransferase